MIERYTHPEMATLWSDENRFKTWLDVELAVLKVLGQKKVVPAQVASQISSKAKIKVDRIHELEETLHHDVIAFTQSISEQVGEVGRYFHFGLTSSDVVDTALAILMTQALEKVLKTIDGLDQELVKQALKYRTLPCMGRTHGVHAEPTSFGLKFLGWVEEFRRQRARLVLAMEGMRYGKLSGAVGSYGALTPDVEEKALDILGLKVEPVATQVLPRDRHAEVFSVLANLGGSIERVAVELRHLQRTEVHEVEEEFGQGQKGSSAMPHKKNPISAENLTGCARLLRGYAASSFENIALWHERDISHSSVERVIAPDATTLAHYMVLRLTKLLKNLKVRKEDVERNLGQTQGIYFSGHVLLALVDKGMSREEGYAIVQRVAHQAWAEAKPFSKLLWDEKVVASKFKEKEFFALFDVNNYLRNVDSMYERVLKNEFKPKSDR